MTRRYLQISAPVQPGNSGGPLLDGSGNLVGIVFIAVCVAATETRADSFNLVAGSVSGTFITTGCCDLISNGGGFVGTGANTPYTQALSGVCDRSLHLMSEERRFRTSRVRQMRPG
jgi:hypothetical protein